LFRGGECRLYAQGGTINSAGTLRVPSELRFNGVQDVGHFCGNDFGNPPSTYSFNDFVATAAISSDGQGPIYRWMFRVESGAWQIALTLQDVTLQTEKKTELKRLAAHPDNPTNFSIETPTIFLGRPTAPQYNAEVNCVSNLGSIQLTQEQFSKYPYNLFTLKTSGQAD
jgi:hypothetical protein